MKPSLALRLIAVLTLLVVSLAARAEFGPPPSAPAVGIDQRLGAQLPMGLELTDTRGRLVRLGEYFQAGRPVVLVLGYYRCANLCGMLMQGTLEALQASGLSSAGYTLLGVSIDPLDTPATASARARVYERYAQFLQDSRPDAAPPARPRLLVGSEQATAGLARAVGFRFEPNGEPVGIGTEGADIADPGGRFAHAAGIVVATPRGQVSSYLMGVRFEPQSLRHALVEASGGRIGTLADRIALLCAHFDPRRGRYSASIMNALRMLGIGLTLALAGYAWRHRRGAAPPRSGT